MQGKFSMSGCPCARANPLTKGTATASDKPETLASVCKQTCNKSSQASTDDIKERHHPPRAERHASGATPGELGHLTTHTYPGAQFQNLLLHHLNERILSVLNRLGTMGFSSHKRQASFCLQHSASQGAQLDGIPVLFLDRQATAAPT